MPKELLLPNCNLVAMFGMKSSINENIFPEIKRKHQRHALLELDWDGEIVKKYQVDLNKNEKIHHDFQINSALALGIVTSLPSSNFNLNTRQTAPDSIASGSLGSSTTTPCSAKYG